MFVVILCLGGLINEKISRKPISSKELEDLIRKISLANNPKQIEAYVNESKLFDYQKEIIIRIAQNSDICPEARKGIGHGINFRLKQND